MLRLTLTFDDSIKIETSLNKEVIFESRGRFQNLSLVRLWNVSQKESVHTTPIEDGDTHSDVNLVCPFTLRYLQSQHNSTVGLNQAAGL